MGFHFLAFWPCGPSFPCILAFSGSASGPPPQVAKNCPFAQRPYNGFIRAVTGSILQFLAFWAFISLHFGLVGLHFLACLCGLHFLAFWPFRGQLLVPPPTSCQKWPVCPTSLQWIYQGRDRLHFAVFSLLGLHFLAFWPCGPSFPCILALWAFISFHFGLLGIVFLSFLPFGPCLPFILAFSAFISLHFGFLGLHFLAFWPRGPSFPFILVFRGQLLGSSPQVAKNCLFAQRPYNGFISAVTGSILQFLAFWAFISLHFGLVGFHFLAFWPCSFLAFWAFISFHFGLVGLHFLAFWPRGPSFPCILALWAFISFHFGLVGLHFLAFWPCRPSFPFILALWAFISLHFGLVGLHFLSFWPFRGQLLGSSPQVAKNGPFAQRPYNGFISAVTGSILQFFAFGAFSSLHFGLVGLYFLAFWPRGSSFPFILAFSGSASGALPTNCQKWPVRPTSLQWIYQRRDRRHFAVSSLVGFHFLAFWPCGPSFPCILSL